MNIDKVINNDIIGVVTDRSWRTEAALLRIGNEIDWKGKHILSLGSGKKQEDPDTFFKGAKVTACDPSFFTGTNEQYQSLPDILKKARVIRRDENKSDNLVKARAQELPFAENTFDLITSTFAVPMNVQNELKIQSLIECMRVCKYGGQVRLYPVNEITQPDIVSFLEESGWNYRFEGSGQPRVLILYKEE